MKVGDKIRERDPECQPKEFTGGKGVPDGKDVLRTGSKRGIHWHHCRRQGGGSFRKKPSLHLQRLSILRYKNTA